MTDTVPAVPGAPVQYALSEGVAQITLAKPAKRNALCESDLDLLSQCLDQAKRDGARALLLRGQGVGFCAGRDLAAVDFDSDDAGQYLRGKVQPLLQRLAGFPAPTFAAAQGACLGVGLGLLIACDVVYVDEAAKIGSPFASLGALLDCGGHALFYERLGAHRTLDLAYSGEFMSGSEAVQAGLFSRALASDALQAAARAAAVRAAAGPTAAFLATKRVVAELRAKRLGLWEVMETEAQLQGELSITADYQEGMAAFKSKRPPVFTGR